MFHLSLGQVSKNKSNTECFEEIFNNKFQKKKPENQFEDQVVKNTHFFGNSGINFFIRNLQYEFDVLFKPLLTSHRVDSGNEYQI